MTRDVRDVKIDLTKLMRTHKVTIRELARRMQIPMTRVRDVRSMTKVPYLSYCDFVQAVTGVNVFSRARWDAMQRESGR